MKGLWKRIDTKWQFILKMASIIVILTGGGFTINGVINWGRDIGRAPEEIDTLFIEVGLLKNEVDFLLECQEMTWQMFRENTRDLDILDYYIILENGLKYSVDIRKSSLGNDMAFISNFTILPARWSATDRKYYILDYAGNDYLIYKENGN